MSKTFTKFIALQIENVRVTKNDEINYVVETLRIQEVDGEEKERYAFEGYSGSITGALKLIVSRGLLVNQERSDEVTDTLNKMVEANNKIMRFIEENRGKLN